MLPQSSTAIARIKASLKLALQDKQAQTRIGETHAPDTHLASQHLLEALKSSGHSSVDAKYCLECASRELLYEIIADTDQENIDGSSQILFNFFDTILLLSELDICDQQLPFAVIEETLDTQPIEGCKRIFSYLESRIERLTVGVDGTKGKGIILLRLCNELLRRLSKSEDTVFCGRIFVFLTKSFPLSERSGVNLRGEFHIENKTTFDEDGASAFVSDSNFPGDVKFENSSLDNMDAMEVLPSEAALAIDASNKLYKTLWSTQHDFAEPVRLFQKQNLDNFKSSLETVVKAFKSAIDEHGYNVPSTGTDIRRATKRKRDDDDEEEVRETLDSYNPKYLTSRELFNLEVRDLVFRRHILVQFLIIIEFLLSLSPKHKKYLEAEAKNRSVQFPYTLTDEDDKWAEAAKKDIVSALNHKSGMDGLLFSRTVDSVLTREKNWVKWKADNCVSFEMPAVPSEDVKQSRGRGSDSAQLPRNIERGMGAPALSRVWFDTVADEGAMTSLKRIQRVGLPEYKEYNKAIEGYHLDKDFAVSDQEKDELDGSIANKSWRALRIASRDKFHLFKVLDEDLSIKSLIAAEDSLLAEKKEPEKEHKKELVTASATS